MEFRRYDPHSGHITGSMRRGEGSQNASLGGKWCLFSDPSPVRANRTIHPITNRYQTIRLAPISVDYYEYTLQSWHNLLHPE